MASLAYPQDFQSGTCPFVVFVRKEYKLPSAKMTKADLTTFNKGKIALYFPEGFSENVGSEWGYESIINITSGWSEGAQSAARAIGNNLEKQMSGLSNTAKANVGSTMGPADMLTFKKAKPFSLNFNYSFIPISSSEGTAVKNIIREFKESPMPKWQDAGAETMFIKFPDIWDIYFFNIEGPGNPVIGNAYANMALTSCAVTYGQGSSSVLVYKDKTSVQTQMTLTFESIQYGVKE